MLAAKDDPLEVDDGVSVHDRHQVLERAVHLVRDRDAVHETLLCLVWHWMVSGRRKSRLHFATVHHDQPLDLVAHRVFFFSPSRTVKKKKN